MSSFFRGLVTILILHCLVSSLVAAVSGVVTDAAGNPLARAWVYDTSTGRGVLTDEAGRFELTETSSPARLGIIHSGFQRQTVDVAAATGAIRVELQRAHLLHEDVMVTATAPRPGFSPPGSAATTVDASKVSVPPSTIGEVAQVVPGVAENGQGGLFQGLSVRGVGKQRVQFNVDGIRLAAERRAGVSASFIDPLLVGSVEVLRGPASSYHGSGALGGVLGIGTRRFDRFHLESGFESQGSENYQLVGWGDNTWSVGLVRRTAGNSESAAGNPLNTHFDQYSAVIKGTWYSRENIFNLSVVPTYGEDIGKSNSSYPDETSSYPRERHLLVSFLAQTSGLWEFRGYIHPNDLQTSVLDAETRQDVFNNSFDWGFDVGKSVTFNRCLTAHFRGDYFGRRNVDALEEDFLLDSVSGNAIDERRTLEDAREDEFGMRGSLRAQVGPATIEGGSRVYLQHQQNASLPGSTDATWSAFTGAELLLAPGFRLNASLGSGLRFPSLSERFYSGATGRGSVIGNPDLVPERSLDIEAGALWSFRKISASAFVFRNRINDYIERVQIESDLYTFENLVRGTVRGIEWEGAVELVENWSIFGRGHHVAGTDDGGEPLADIPVDRMTIGSWYGPSRWRGGGDWEFRSRKGLPASGEKAITSAHLVTLFVYVSLPGNFGLTASVSNLLNEEYFPTADRRAAEGPGRSFGIRLNWTPE